MAHPRTRRQVTLRLRARHLDPGSTFLDAFTNRKDFLVSTDARAVLAIAPTPAAAAKLTKTRIAAAARALLAALDTACTNVDQLGEACAAAFAQHPDYEIITSFPGLGDLTGARVLAEIGDDRNRFTDARAVQAYAGSAPVTRASGRSISITHRRIKNDRLAAVGFIWAFIATNNSTGARAHYDRRRQDHGDRHAAALPNLFNRFLGCLHQCLTTGQTYSETKAFPTPIEVTA